MNSNDLYINYLSRASSGFMGSQLAGAQVKGVRGFQDYVNAGVQRKSDGKEAAAGDGISSAEKVRTVETMTLEEYKQYIHMKISQIPMHPSQVLRSVSIHISDEGFQAMQEDPEYEKWVLDTLKQDFGFYDPWASVCGGSFTIHRFGATREEYRSDSCYMGFQGGKRSSIMDNGEKSFWEKRVKRHKKYLKLQQEVYEQKLIMKRVFREEAIRRGDIKNMFAKDGAAQCFNLASILLMLDKTEK